MLTVHLEEGVAVQGPLHAALGEGDGGVGPGRHEALTQGVGVLPTHCLPAMKQRPEGNQLQLRREQR